MSLTSEQKSRARIMLVDDEEAIVRLLSLVLRQHGLTHVVTCTEGRLAMDVFDQTAPDLVVLDLNMPGVSGLVLLEMIRAKAPEVPVLIVSGYGDRRLRIDCLSKGARDFIEKPFDLETVSRIFNQLELRLVHAQLASDQAQGIELAAQLRDAQFEVARRLAVTAEYRHDETGLQVLRMGYCAALLAEAFGLAESECVEMRHASALHDVGKIGIPDHILNKPGRLTADEFAVMKTHTTIGANILSGSSGSLLQQARVIARHHHERWDGSGYPDGLKGEAIPLTARLVAIADVFDALTSARSYRSAWAVDAAVAEVLKGRGTHFMPALIDCFIQVLPRILDMRLAGADVALD